MQSSESGLRERKRVETRDRLQTAAVTLVDQRGMEHATLDAICKEADVSTRTFFNYFDSKEDAILGLEDVAITSDSVSDLLGAHVGSGPIELTIRMVFGLLNPSVDSSAQLPLRMKIINQYPQLLGRMANQAQRMTQQLTAAMGPILRETSNFADQDETESEISVEILLSLCSGATRVAIKEWAASGSQAPIEAVEQRANELVKNIVKRLK
jgi:AcrR family transcriptional regulator